jgi:NADH-quinone oxidoreductase subunit J
MSAFDVPSAALGTAAPAAGGAAAVACYAACAVALICALMVITQRNAMHALLYLILMLLALGLVFFTLGAPFAAVLQVAIYAGAVMVLFVFVVMMLNLGPASERQERRWLGAGIWAVPAALTGALLAIAIYALGYSGEARVTAGVVTPKEVGISLFQDYLIAVELASLLLVAGLVGAFHLAPTKGERDAVGSADGHPPAESL